MDWSPCETLFGKVGQGSCWDARAWKWMNRAFPYLALHHWMHGWVGFCCLSCGAERSWTSCSFAHRCHCNGGDTDCHKWDLDLGLNRSLFVEPHALCKDASNYKGYRLKILLLCWRLLVILSVLCKKACAKTAVSADLPTEEWGDQEFLLFGTGSINVAQRSLFLDYMGITVHKNHISITFREQIFSFILHISR